MIITIDGPAASGKSTIARMTAESLHFYYLNSGLLYRSVAYLLMQTQEYTQKQLAAVLVEDLEQCTDTQRFFYSYDSIHGPVILYDEKDITPFLKDALMDQCVAIISPQKIVREALSELQRSIAKSHDSVVEGRDVGSVVFPDADYKFYLTASLDVRSKRWQAYQEKKGTLYSLKEAAERVESRDSKDRGRELSPLVVPANALTIDNSTLTLEETVQEILRHIKN
jgi:cytidylate kinase